MLFQSIEEQRKLGEKTGVQQVGEFYNASRKQK